MALWTTWPRLLKQAALWIRPETLKPTALIGFWKVGVNMKRFAASKLESYMLKSELTRVNSGYGFLYEMNRRTETERLLSELHKVYGLRRVSKSVFWKR